MPPRQADEFTVRVPGLGAVGELRVGHSGPKEWHLERVEVVEAAAGATHFFPCGKWVKGSGPGGAMARCLQLQGYTTDPASLPVQYRAELAVAGASGALGPDSLRLTLFGARGDSGVVRLDASAAAPGATLACVFEAPNVGQLQRLRIGLAADEGGAGELHASAASGGCTPQHPGAHASGLTQSLHPHSPAPCPSPTAGRPRECALLLGRIAVTHMVTGEAATFACSEWLRSSDPYDFELDTAQEGEGQVGEGGWCQSGAAG